MFNPNGVGDWGGWVPPTFGAMYNQGNDLQKQHFVAEIQQQQQQQQQLLLEQHLQLLMAQQAGLQHGASSGIGVGAGWDAQQMAMMQQHHQEGEQRAAMAAVPQQQQQQQWDEMQFHTAAQVQAARYHFDQQQRYDQHHQALRHQMQLQQQPTR